MTFTTDSDVYHPAMDPFTHAEYARLRIETSNIMVTLKREIEIKIENPTVTLDDKKEYVKERVQNAHSLVSSVSGQLTSSLALAKTLVTSFSDRVHTNLEDIDTSIKNSNPNALRFSRSQFGPGILTPYLDDNWDKIPSTLQAIDPLSLSDMAQVQEKKIRDLSDMVDAMNADIKTLQEKVKMPCKSVLAKIWGDCEHICKLRKRNDTVWDQKPKEENEKEIREKMASLEIKDINVAFEKIMPRGKATPFVKMTFLSVGERKFVTGRLNSIRDATGYIISPCEPRECADWLPTYKRDMKNIIMTGFIEKGYQVTPEDFFCLLQVRYAPFFRFVWRVRVKAYEVDVLLETDKIYAQIPELENRERLDATQTMEINVDPADIHTENISQDVKKRLGHDTENFVHTEETKAKEVDTLTMVVELVRLVIKVSKSYHNDPRRVKKVRVATSTSKFLTPLMEKFEEYRKTFTEGGIPANYFKRNLKAFQTVTAMLQDESFKGS